MSSDKAPGSDRTAGGRYAETTDSSSQLLQQMLEATLLHRSSDLSPEEWAGLRAVAIDANARGLGMTERIEALVKKLLSGRFAHFHQDQASFEHLCRKIALALGSDPYARQRLDEFQEHLLRSKP